MSKKIKSRHRIPALTLKSDPITPEYQAEIDRSMERLEARYRKAQKALEAAEVKAERARVHADNLARKQSEAEAIAANRLANEKKLSEHIERIKEAARNARVAEARAEMQRRQEEVIVKRNAETARRQAEAKETRERQRLIAQSQHTIRRLEDEVAERRRELRQIERLMMPTNYAGRAHRQFTAQHTAGER